jgi:isopenicillin N synthase-like dioxygenase
MEGVAREVMRLVALALDLPESWFDDKFDDHMTEMAANHYLPAAETQPAGEFRNDPHQDWGTLTLLHQGDGNDGLEVLSADGSATQSGIRSRDT